MKNMDRLLLQNISRRFGVLSYTDRFVAKRPFRTLCNSTASKQVGEPIKHPRVCPMCRSSLPKVYSARQWKAHRLELRAVASLLERSGLLQRQELVNFADQYRHFSTSPTNYCEQEKEKKPTDQKKKSSHRNDKDYNKKNEDEEDEDDEIQQLRKLYFNMLVTIGTILFILSLTTISNNQVNITEEQLFSDLLLTGEVRQILIKNNKALIVLHPGALINGQPLTTPFLRMKLSDPDKFEVKLREFERASGIKVEDAIPVMPMDGEFEYKLVDWIWSFVFLMILIGVILSVAGRSSTILKGSSQFKSAAKFIRGDIKFKQEGGVTFKDVAGLKEAKVEIMEFVDFLKKPERFHELGAKVPHGSLLLGPPGCGKTLLAKAVATEANVPFLAMAGSEFIEMVGGLGASRVRDLFKEARKCAPCIVYIDEIDAIGKKRSSNVNAGGGSSEGEQTLNQLLVEMDGMGTTEGVIVMASTNIAHVLDKALLRPGRFDRHIMIDYPTMEERKEIFQMYLQKLKLDPALTGEAAVERLAQLTPGMTGADINNVCNEAALYAARFKKEAVTAPDFDYAIERVIAGVAKKTSVMSVKEKKVIAYHESGHALVGWMLKHTDGLLKISIVPRTSNVLGFAQYVPSDHKLTSAEQLFDRMCMALGGRAAESIIFNKITTGAQDDLKKVTEMAYNQVRMYGMSDVVGPISFPSSATEFGQKPYSKKLATMIDREAQMLVTRAYKHTEKVLLDNKDKLHSLAKRLLEKETLQYEEVETLLGPPPHGRKTVIDLSAADMVTPPTGSDIGNGNKNGPVNGNARDNR